MRFSNELLFPRKTADLGVWGSSEGLPSVIAMDALAP